MGNEFSDKQFVVNEELDFYNGRMHVAIINTQAQVAEGNVTASSTANSIIATIAVAAGARIQVTRVWMSVEGSSGSGHFDFQIATTEFMPVGYLASPGETERVGTVKDPVVSYQNTTAASKNFNLTILAPITANTYYGEITYMVLDDNRPSV